MKLVFCVGQLHEPGGTEKVLANKVNYLANKGYEIHIITVSQNNKPYFYKFDKKIKFHNIEYNKSKILIHPFLFIRNIIFFREQYKKLFKKIKPDIITVNERGYLDFIIPFINSKIPKIREFHSSKKAIKLHTKQMNSFLKKIIHTLRYIVLYNLFNLYDYIILLTEGDYIDSNYKTKVEIIPNMHKPEVTKKSNLNSNKVISVGSMNGNIKRFDLQINLWKEIMEENPELNNWTLNIFGDGKNKSKLQEQIKLLGMSKHILLHGKSKMLYKEYLNSSINIFTSIGEGFGMVLIESMSYGVPSISFDCPHGPSEIITDKIDGFLIKNDNVEDFKTKLILLMKNDKLRKELGNNAFNNSQKFLPNNVGKKWENLYKKTLKNET